MTNGTASGFGGQWNNSYQNVGTRMLRIVSPQIPVVTQDGYVDVVDLHGGSFHAYAAYNDSSHTARVDVVGANRWQKSNGFDPGNGSFQKGGFLFNLHSGSTLTYYCGNQRASFNNEGVVVKTVGAGTVTLQNDSLGTSNAGGMYIRNGACFDHDGELKFDTQYALVTGNGVIGPNVKKVSASNANGKLLRVYGAGVTLNVPDVDFKTTGSSAIVGNGTVNIDCTMAAHTFVANSPKTYDLPGTKGVANSLTVSKTGAYEATVNSTNLMNVWVREGAMRFTGVNCTVTNLTAEAEAEAVVDGVTLTLDADGSTVTRPALRTANGGRIVYAGEGDCYLLEPRLAGSVWVQGGSLVPTAAAGEKVDGLAAATPIQAQVDAGATLDLTAYTETAQTIDGLTVSTAAASGTIKGGVLAEAGTVTVDAFDYDNPPAPVAIDLDGVARLDRLANWRVVRRGAPLYGVVASYDGEAKKLKIEMTVNYLHITEAGAGDLTSYYADNDLLVKIDAGVFYTNTAAFVGSHGIAIDASDTGRLVSNTRSDDYTGTILVNSGTLFGDCTNALGRGTVEIAGSTTGTCRLQLGSSSRATSYDNDIVLWGNSGSSGHSAINLVTGSQKQIRINGDITAYGDLYITDSGASGGQNKNVVYFTGAVTAEGYRIDYPCDNNVRWQGPVICKDFYCWANYPRMGSHYLYSSANRIGVIYNVYNGVYLAGDDALGGAAFNLSDPSYKEDAGRGSLYLSGHSASVAYLAGVRGSAASWDRCIDYNSSSAATLTITGGASVVSAVAQVHIGLPKDGKNYGKCTFVVNAANGDFVQELTNSSCYTQSPLIVSNGTLRLTGTSSFRYASSLTVSGGCFDLDVTTADACSNMTAVTVGAGATLRVGASAVTPFDDGKKAVLTLDREGAIELPEGAAVTVNKVYWSDGVLLPAGVYTGAEGAHGDRTVLPLIRGAGTLTVLKGYGTLLIVR